MLVAEATKDGIHIDVNVVLDEQTYRQFASRFPTSHKVTVPRR